MRIARGLFLMAMVVALFAGRAAAATLSETDGAGLSASVTVVQSGADPIVAGSRPAVQVAVDLGQEPGAVGVQCGFAPAYTEPASYSSCGARNAACPVSQCWSYTPTIAPDGQYDLQVKTVDSSGSGLESVLLRFYVDGAPPQITLKGAPCIECAQGAVARGHIGVGFQWTIEDAQFADSDRVQCAVTTGARPSAWKGCTEDTNFVLPSSNRAYRFWARPIDPAGLIGPTVESVPFATEPCRAELLSSSLHAFLHGGLRVRMHCVQPEQFGVQLDLSDHEDLKLSARDGLVRYGLSTAAYGRTRAVNQTTIVKVRPQSHLRPIVRRTHPLGIEVRIGLPGEIEQDFAASLR